MQKLIFVYNADGGFFNVAADMAHKIFSPSTYPCSLCDLTYGIFKIRPEWDAFIQAAPVPFEFLHKAEFHAQYPALQETALPVVLKQTGEHVSEFISAAQLSNFTTIQALKAAILSRLDHPPVAA